MFGVGAGIIPAFGGLFVSVLWIIFAFCLVIAPLVIWRNTSRTNRLLEHLLFLLGAKEDEVEESVRALPGAQKRTRPEQDEILRLLREIAATLKEKR